MKIVVIDGQGGRIGKALVAGLKAAAPQLEITAIGTNSMASIAMSKAGADRIATGENPVIVAAADADIIAGPIGIILANALLGEITPKMAEAVSASRAEKVLIPVNKCRVIVAGVEDMSINDYVRLAVEQVIRLTA